MALKRGDELRNKLEVRAANRDVKQAKLFSMDEESIWTRACKTKDEYDIAVRDAKERKGKKTMIWAPNNFQC